MPLDDVALIDLVQVSGVHATCWVFKVTPLLRQ